MSKKTFMCGLAVLIGMVFTGCNEQPNLPTCVDDKSRVAIAVLINSFSELEANQNKLEEEIRLMRSEKNGIQTKIVTKEIVQPESNNKKESSRLLTAKTFSIKYVTKENVNVRDCPEKTCKIKDVLLKGHIFWGEEPLDNGWIETKDHTFVYSGYVKKAKN